MTVPAEIATAALGQHPDDVDGTKTNGVEDRPVGGRARPLSPDERRAMIIDAVIPLIIEHGRSVTSKQMAEAAGIAEGTVFRAFGDKDTLIDAAVQRYLDVEPLRTDLRAIDPHLPLDEKVETLVVLIRARFGGVFRMMAALGASGQRPPDHPGRGEYVSIIEEVLAPDLDRLNVPRHRVAHFVRLLAFASSFPRLNDGVSFDDDELTALILYGIAGTYQGESAAEVLQQAAARRTDAIETTLNRARTSTQRCEN